MIHDTEDEWEFTRIMRGWLKGKKVIHFELLYKRFTFISCGIY